MEESVNYAEYTVAKKAEGKTKQKKMLLIALYILVIVVFGVIIAVTSGAAAIWATIVVPLFIALIFFTQRLVKEEMERRPEILASLDELND